MPLQKQNVPLRVGGGVMQDADEFLLDAPAALDVDNGRFTKAGAIDKRRPMVPVASIVDGDIFALADDGQTLVAMTRGGSHAYDATADRWRELNPSAPRVSRVLTDPLIRTNGSTAHPAIASIGDLVCCVWVDEGDAGIYAGFFRADKPGTLIAGPTLIASQTVPVTSGFLPHRLIAHGGRFALAAHVAGGDFNLYVCNPAVSLTFASVATWSSSALVAFDVVPSDVAGSVVLVYGSVSGSTASTVFRYVGLTGTLGTPQTYSDSEAGAGTLLAAAYNPASGDIVALRESGSVIRCALPLTSSPTLAITLTSDFKDAITATTLESTSTERHTRGSITVYDASGRMVMCRSGTGGAEETPSLSFVTVGGPRVRGLRTGTDVQLVSAAYTVTQKGTIPTLTLAGRGAQLATVGDSTADSGVILPMIDAASEYPAGYLVRVRPTTDSAPGAPALCGRFLVDKIRPAGARLGPGIYDSAAPHGLPTLVGDEWWWVAATESAENYTGTRPAPGGGFANYSLPKGQIDLVRARFADMPQPRSATASGLRLIGDGSGVTVLDGVHHAELTPPPLAGPMLYYVEDAAGAPFDYNTHTGHTYVANPTFTYRAFWRWTDADGLVHRGPYRQFDVYLPDPLYPPTGGATALMGVHFPAPYPTALLGERAQRLELEIYLLRTDGIYHFLGIANPAPSWVPGFVKVTFTWYDGPANTGAHHLGMGAAGDTGGTLMYTDSELDALQPPPLLDITSTQSRVWGLSAEDRLSVWPSKPLMPGIAPEFSEQLVIRVPAEGGECVALASLGDKIAVFKQRQVYSIFGEPGAADGSGSTVQRPKLMVADIGCVNPLSVVEVLPLGVLFESQKGIALMSPSGQVEIVGAAARDMLAGRTIVGSALVASEDEVRWALAASESSDTDVIVYNYRRQAWGRWSGVGNIVAMHDYRGTCVIATDDQEVHLESEDWEEARHLMKVATPWIKLAGTQGYKRLYRLALLLRAYTSAPGTTQGLAVDVYYDYRGDSTESHAWTGTTLHAIGDGDGAAVQVSLDPLVSKCESFRIVLREVGVPAPTKGTYGARGFEFVGVDAVVGQKSGSYRHKMADGGKA